MHSCRATLTWRSRQWNTLEVPLVMNRHLPIIKGRLYSVEKYVCPNGILPLQIELKTKNMRNYHLDILDHHNGVFGCFFCRNPLGSPNSPCWDSTRLCGKWYFEYTRISIIFGQHSLPSCGSAAWTHARFTALMRPEVLAYSHVSHVQRYWKSQLQNSK